MGFANIKRLPTEPRGLLFGLGMSDLLTRALYPGRLHAILSNCWGPEAENYIKWFDGNELEKVLSGLYGLYSRLYNSPYHLTTKEERAGIRWTFLYLCQGVCYSLWDVWFNRFYCILEVFDPTIIDSFFCFSQDSANVSSSLEKLVASKMANQELEVGRICTSH